MNIAQMKENRRIIASFPYQWKALDKGYTDQTLYINVGGGDGTICSAEPSFKVKPVAPEVKEKFIGGKGYDLRLLWDAVKSTTKWRDPENEIVISGGPCCGITQYSGSGKCIVTSISPQSDRIIDSNVGGHFGPHLKFSGFDALEVQGISKEDVIDDLKLRKAIKLVTDSAIVEKASDSKPKSKPTTKKSQPKVTVKKATDNNQKGDDE